MFAIVYMHIHLFPGELRASRQRGLRDIEGAQSAPHRRPRDTAGVQHVHVCMYLCYVLVEGQEV